MTATTLVTPPILQDTFSRRVAGHTGPPCTFD
jgi:hypothetical protein